MRPQMYIDSDGTKWESRPSTAVRALLPNDSLPETTAESVKVSLGDGTVLYFRQAFGWLDAATEADRRKALAKALARRAR